ncbi:MAG: hypothetical protein AB7R99_29995, partial [Pseudonocardia sp.]
MTASALAGPTATGSAVSPLPSKDRSGLTSSALHLLDRITREGSGADVHHAVAPASGSTHDSQCDWCPDTPRPVSVLAHHDGGLDGTQPTLECCLDCVPAVMAHLSDQGVHPETVTLDVELSAPLAHGWDRLLVDLSAGLDLDQWAGRVTLAARLVRTVDVPTLRALAAWLVPSATSASLPDRQARLVADAWAAHAATAAVTA